MSDDSWSLAVELVVEFVKRPARMSHLLERIPADWDGGRRRACQSLLFGTVRHLRLLEKCLDEFVKRRPKPWVWAALLVSSRELMEQPERGAKIVHHAVSKVGARFGRGEKGLVNAVLRKVGKRLPELLEFEAETPAQLAWRYSHPKWLVKRWLEQFGRESTLGFLKWNQSESAVFARWQRNGRAVDALEPLASCDGFYRVRAGEWGEIAPLLKEGSLYVQNPAASVAPRLLMKAVPEGRYLDLCAAPGGKGLLLEAESGERIREIVSLDLEGRRLELMRENFERYGARRLRVVAGDVLAPEGETLGLFEGVLLDAPCSNSGVFQHKIDARWRQSLDGLRDLMALQLEMLEAASERVSLGGALVYSTCSVDPCENEELVAAFLETSRGERFELEESCSSLPWRDERDGAGAFLLRRKS